MLQFFFPELTRLQCLLQNPLQSVQNQERKGVEWFHNFLGSKYPNICFKSLAELHWHSLNVIQGNTQEKFTKIDLSLD